MTDEEFRPLMVEVECLWPATKWTPTMLAVWFKWLRERDVEAVRRAVELLVRKHVSPHAPSLGMLLEILESREAEELPTLDEVLKVARLAARREGCRLDSITGRYPDDLAWEVEAQMGVLGADFVRLVGAERLLVDATPGSFVRRDLQSAWDQHVERFTDRRARSSVGQLERGGESAQLTAG